MKKLYVFLGLFLSVVVLGAASCNFSADNESANIEADTSEESQTSDSNSDVNVDANVNTSVATAKTVTITYNGTAFSPASVTVKAGDTVKFVSASETPVWPASGPHPTHTNLPGFDAKESLANGASYSYKFTKTGSWAFHNHLNPSQTGKVVVE